jgi:putative aldouronate transport system substrate-binding protein
MKQPKGYTRTAAGAALLSMTLLLAQACSGQGPSTSSPAGAAGGKTEAQAEAPTDISIMIDFTLAEPPGDDNVIKKEIEKLTNTRLKFTWVSSNNYVDKQNVTLASGDLPDMIMIDDPFAAQVKQMIKQGAFWDITPYIKDYPNLTTRIPKDSWDNSKIGGKNYGVPRMRPLDGGGSFPLVRKDWLDHVYDHEGVYGEGSGWKREGGHGRLRRIYRCRWDGTVRLGGKRL